jgi:phage shock protein C
MEGKRFGRSNNSYICGVCAGLAEYIGMDATLMRVLWVVAAILTWFWLAVVAYIVLAFVMAQPEGAPEGERFWHHLQGRNVMIVLALLLIGSGAFIIVQQILHISMLQYVLPVGLIIGGALLMAFAFGSPGRRGK